MATQAPPEPQTSPAPAATAAGTAAVILAAVEAEANALAAIKRALVAALSALWRPGALDPYSPASVDAFVRQAGSAVQHARRAAAGVSDAYMRRVLDALDLPNAPHAPVAPLDIPDLPRGIPVTTEWVRPIKEYRRVRLLGLDEAEAQIRAERRQQVMANMDVATAARDARQFRLALADKITGWRRVVHPELSMSGHTCGLCLAAADRVYKNLTKQALHDRCNCTILPVTAAHDPGSPLNADTLANLYELAGGRTDRGALSHVRYAVNEHAELGPILVNARDNVRTPADVAKDAPRLVETAHVELAALQEALDALLARDKAGEDVTDLLAWNRDRMAAVQALVGAA